MRELVRSADPGYKTDPDPAYVFGGGRGIPRVFYNKRNPYA